MKNYFNKSFGNDGQKEKLQIQDVECENKKT